LLLLATSYAASPSLAEDDQDATGRFRRVGPGRTCWGRRLAGLEEGVENAAEQASVFLIALTGEQVIERIVDFIDGAFDWA